VRLLRSEHLWAFVCWNGGVHHRESDRRRAEAFPGVDRCLGITTNLSRNCAGTQTSPNLFLKALLAAILSVQCHIQNVYPVCFRAAASNR